MTNPVFNNSAVFGEKANRDVQRTQAQQMHTGASMATDAAQLDHMYNAPAATTADTGRMTYDDVIMKTGFLFVLLVVTAAVTWNVAPGLYFIGAIVGLVLGLINAFKKQPSPPLIIAYTIAQGVFLGGLSFAFENMVVNGQPLTGIVMQAVLATLSVFAVSLFLFKSGKVRVTPKFTRIVLIGMAGYLVFTLLNAILVWTGVLDGWGMRGGALGIGIGILAVILAAMSLVMDFDAASTGVKNGIPKKYAWSAAFGLMVTLIWLYIELLRLIAILRGSE
ncbi:Bax inhibitor-1/YccA family protein [Timonella sp. A28]|uniref:Bax inhibitor-1/YccA family protein n=1 Tax=Timonella sp. A28 TaxID=3442640 RepID=UPI003EBD4B7E